MFVTVSGLVGSGKTTVAKHLVRTFRARQDTAVLWNFRRLPCFHPTGRPAGGVGRRPGRGAGHRLKPLTARTTLGYVARILAFRFYLLRHRSATHQVINRYFYDNLVHFTLEGTRERIYLWLLARLIPTPDVAILAVASIDTTMARRPWFAKDYVSTLHGSYLALTRRFPNLVVVVTDPGSPSLENAETAVRTTR
jgi:thymidylate kinase